MKIILIKREKKFNCHLHSNKKIKYNSKPKKIPGTKLDFIKKDLKFNYQKPQTSEQTNNVFKIQSSRIKSRRKEITNTSIITNINSDEDLRMNYISGDEFE